MRSSLVSLSASSYYDRDVASTVRDRARESGQSRRAAEPPA